jgi:hypothetical protein
MLGYALSANPTYIRDRFRIAIACIMIDLQYSLVIEATKESDFFGFYSPELEGFTEVGHSIEDCIHKVKTPRLKE